MKRFAIRPLLAAILATFAASAPAALEVQRIRPLDRPLRGFADIW